MNSVLVILALGLLCAAWALFQRWISRVDPAQPGVEGHCTCTPKLQEPPDPPFPV